MNALHIILFIGLIMIGTGFIIYQPAFNFIGGVLFGMSLIQIILNGKRKK